MNQQEWIKQRNYFKLGCGVSVAFLLMSFFSPIIYSSDDLRTETFIYESAFFKKGKSSSVIVHFSNEIGIFYIHEYEKKFLNRMLFSQLQRGDNLFVSFRDEDIYQIRYRNMELIDKSKVDKYKIESRRPMRYMSLTALILCFVPYSFKRQPSFRLFRRTYLIKANLIWIVGLVIVLLAVRLCVYVLNPEL